MEQADEGVALHDVKVNVGEWLKIGYFVGGGYQEEEQAQAGNLGGFFHDVHAIQIVGDDALPHVVIDGRVILADVFQVGGEVGIVQEVNLAIDSGV